MRSLLQAVITADQLLDTSDVSLFTSASEFHNSELNELSEDEPVAATD